MFKYIVGNILDTECKYILNPVNCVGTMGKGLALQIAKAYPESVGPYKEDCKKDLLNIGQLTSFKAKNGKTIIHFPTKYHWKNPSKYSYIEAGLENLAYHIKYSGNETTYLSFAIPPLGCGLGGLNYDFVHELIQTILGEFKNITFELYVTQEWYDEHVLINTKDMDFCQMVKHTTRNNSPWSKVELNAIITHDLIKQHFTWF